MDDTHIQDNFSDANSEEQDTNTLTECDNVKIESQEADNNKEKFNKTSYISTVQNTVVSLYN